MSIYPDRRKGELTGKFVVEVQMKGQRLRDRCDTIEEAKKLEAVFKSQLVAGVAQVISKPTIASRRTFSRSSRPSTLGEGLYRAEGRLWEGTKDATTSFQRLTTAIDILGTDTKIDDVSTESVDDLITELMAKGLAPSTANRYLSSLSKFLSWCTERGYRLSPLPKFEWRDEDEGRIRWITYDEEDVLMGYLRGDMGLVVRNAILTGMRRSELISLERDQVQNGWVHLWSTKSGSPRSIPITEDQQDQLEYLITAGKMPNGSQLRYEWDMAREKMGLKDDPWFVFHACRHTAATRMVEAGINLAVIQKFMGHKAIQTTLRYAHVNDEMLSDALSCVRNYGHNRRAIPSGFISDESLCRPQPWGESGVKTQVGGKVDPRNSLKSFSGRGETGRRNGLKIRL